jgi:hypothetical protein
MNFLEENMKKTLLTICMTMGFLLSTQYAFAGTSISLNIGMIPVRYDAVCEYPQEEYIWIEGHYCDDHPHHVWVPGHWVPSRHNQGRDMHRPANFQKYQREQHQQGGASGRYEHGSREGNSGYGNYQSDRDNGYPRDHRQNEPGSGNWMKNMNDRVIKRQINSRQTSY